jgi:hypothetical protein
LVQQIGEDIALYFIIDNISELEGTIYSRDEGLRYLVEEPISLTQDKRVQATYKLLLTCRHKSIQVVHLVAEQKHIQLTAEKILNRLMLLSAFSDDVQSVMSSESERNRPWEDALQGSEEPEQEILRTSCCCYIPVEEICD